MAEQLKQQSDSVAAQLQEAKTHHKTFSEKTKSKIEQKDQAIDSLTLQVSQHIGAIAQLQLEQEQLQSDIAAKVAVIEGLTTDLEGEKAERQQMKLMQEEFLQQQQQQHSASIADLESQVESIQSSSALQLQQQQAAAACASAEASSVAQQLGAQLQSTMQASAAF